jgi:RNA polymerase sigma factor (TIGR02999 family)
MDQRSGGHDGYQNIHPLSRGNPFCGRMQRKPIASRAATTINRRSSLGMEPSPFSWRQAAEGASKPAADALFGALYSELRRLARRELARHGAPISLGATSLLHKAYLEFADQSGASFADRNGFMGYAARVMRGLIIDYARSRQAVKRGGQFEITALESDVELAADDRELSRISDALDELAKAEPALAELVDLKFFCGFSFAEIAAMRDLSERTVQRQWEKARIYLYRSIQTNLGT